MRSASDLPWQLLRPQATTQPTLQSVRQYNHQPQLHLRYHGKVELTRGAHPASLTQPLVPVTAMAFHSASVYVGDTLSTVAPRGGAPPRSSISSTTSRDKSQCLLGGNAASSVKY